MLPAHVNGIVGPDGQVAGHIDLRNRTITMRDAATGQLVKMDLGQSDVHVDAALPMYAAGYKLQAGVADVASPPIVVPKASNKYFTWDKDNAFQEVDNLSIGAGGQIPEVSTKLSNDTYTTTEYVLGSFVPTEVEANADAPLRPKVKAMSRIMSALRIARERRVKALLQTSGSWTAANVVTLGGTTKWNGGASSDPIANIHAVQEASLQPVTDIIMSERVYHDFVRNAQVQKFIASKINVPGLPSPEQITANNALLGLPPITVAAMKSKGPTTGTYDYLWGNDVVLLHKPAGIPSDGESIATSYTFRWAGGLDMAPDKVNTLADGSTIFNGWMVREFFWPQRGGRGGSMIVVVHNDAEVFTSTIVGGLIVGAHA